MQIKQQYNFISFAAIGTVATVSKSQVMKLCNVGVRQNLKQIADFQKYNPLSHKEIKAMDNKDMNIDYLVSVLKNLRNVKLTMRQIAKETMMPEHKIYNIVHRKKCTLEEYCYILSTIESLHPTEYAVLSSIYNSEKEFTY